SGRFCPLTVINTEVILYEGSDISYLFGRLTGITDQDESTIIVMTVIVLYLRIGTVVVRVKSLRIPRCFVIAYLIKLNGGIIATPWPKSSSGLCFWQGTGTVYHFIKFD